MIQVHKQNDELGYVGSIDTIDTSIIDDVISRGYIPVISSIGMGQMVRPIILMLTQWRRKLQVPSRQKQWLL